MLDADMILELLRELNAELARRESVGEIGLCGGAVMFLVFKTRPATKDVDGIFAPTEEIRAAARAVARKTGVAEDWLTDAAKGYFLTDPPKTEVLGLSHLRVWAPSAEYMLAMKCISARFDSSDGDDVSFLIRLLGLKNREAVFAIIERYYPRKAIPAKTRFFVEEKCGE